jgi:hypothetical protein
VEGEEVSGFNFLSSSDPVLEVSDTLAAPQNLHIVATSPPVVNTITLPKAALTKNVSIVPKHLHSFQLYTCITQLKKKKRGTRVGLERDDATEESDEVVELPQSHPPQPIEPTPLR